MKILIFRTNVRCNFEVGRFQTVSVPSKLHKYFSKKNSTYASKKGINLQNFFIFQHLNVILRSFAQRGAGKQLFNKQNYRRKMKRDNELRERRNKAILARFNELIRTGKQYQQIYYELEDEFYISSSTIKQIILRAMHARHSKI